MFQHSLHVRTRTKGAIFALGLAFLAQFLFSGEVFTRFQEEHTWEWKTQYTWATCLLLGVVAISIWALFPSEISADDPAQPSLLHSIHLKKRDCLFCAAGFFASIGLYLAVGENFLVDGLWLAGVGFLIVPLWLQHRRAHAPHAFILTWPEGTLIAIATAIGFALRYWRLTEIPSHVDNDVALMGTYALKLIQASNFGWVGISESAHLLSYDQFLAWSMRLFGPNHYGVVMFSVLSGTLALPMIYCLGRELGGRQVGWIAFGLLTVSYTHIHFSRTLFGSFVTLSAILTFYFIFRGLRTHHPLWFALSGLSISWGLLNYDSGRIIPIIVASLIAWQWLWQRQNFRLEFKNWLVLVAGILLGLGPMLGFAIRDFNLFFGRGNVVLLWNSEIWDHEIHAYNTTNVVQILWEQVWRTFLTLHLTGDTSPHFGFTRPMVSPVSAALFVIGLGGFLTRFKDLKWFLGLSWVFWTFLFGGVLTYDPPFWPHLNIALPGIFLLAALSANELMKLFAASVGANGPELVRMGMAVAILVTGVLGWDAYYHFVENNADLRIRISRYLATFPSGFHVYLFSPDIHWEEYAFRFFNRDMPGEVLTPESLVARPPQVTPRAIFVFYNQPNLASTLQRLYPGGQVEDHYDNNNDLAFTTYVLSPPGTILVLAAPPIYPFSLPGWWLIAFVLAAWPARRIFHRVSQRQTLQKERLNEPKRI